MTSTTKTCLKINLDDIKEYVKKSANNSNNYIIIGLNDTPYINHYIYERVLIFLQQKQPTTSPNYKSYCIYTHNNISLHINENGSSNCYNNILRYTKQLNSNYYNVILKSYFQKKLVNDSFESNYSYDNIEYIESLSYIYNNITIELMKVNNKYSIKLVFDNTTSSVAIINLINILTNIV